MEQKLVVVKCNAVKYMGIVADDCPYDWALKDIEAVACKRICDDCVKTLKKRKAREWQLALTRWEKE
ncbi:hypothetical protein MN608_11105 [Microdochium nivale]|nr:hypothetical protein MN608_11105 [Microdochium nivale]